MKIYSNYKETFPEFKKYLNHNKAERCVKELIKKGKDGKVFKLLKKAYESNWRHNERIEDLLKAALKALDTGKATIKQKYKQAFSEIKAAYKQGTDATKTASKIKESSPTTTSSNNNNAVVPFSPKDCTEYNHQQLLFTIPKEIFINHILKNLTSREQSKFFLSCKSFLAYRPILYIDNTRVMQEVVTRKLPGVVNRLDASFAAIIRPKSLEKLYDQMTPYIDKAKDLQYGNFWMTDDDLVTIAKICPSLQKLSLTQISITDVGIAALEKLQKLRQLDLFNCPKLTINCLQSIAKLKKLQTLIFGTKNISTDNIHSVAVELPELKDLWMRGMTITYPVPRPAKGSEIKYKIMQ